MAHGMQLLDTAKGERRQSIFLFAKGLFFSLTLAQSGFAHSGFRRNDHFNPINLHLCMGSPDSAMILFASSTLVPSRRTTRGRRRLMDLENKKGNKSNEIRQKRVHFCLKVAADLRYLRRKKFSHLSIVFIAWYLATSFKQQNTVPQNGSIFSIFP